MEAVLAEARSTLAFAIKLRTMPRPNPTDEIKKYKAEYADLTDDEIRGTMSDFNASAPQYIAGDMILKQRDPIRKSISDLASRVENIERAATKHEVITWSFWLAVFGVILAGLALLR